MWNNQSDYLRNVQYKNSSNLGARIRIHELFNTNTYSMYQWSFDLLLAVAGSQARILEIGCGRGDLWAENAARIPAHWDITLTDFSAGMLQDAQTRLGTQATRFTWETANAEKLPFPDQSFDVILAHYMLYHVENRVQAIAEIRRVLKPQGIFLSMTNGDGHMLELKQLLQEFDPSAPFEINQISRYFSVENGAAQLGSAFGDIVLLPFTGDLLVTNPEPMIDYIFSMDYFIKADEATRERLRTFAQARFAAANGRFFIRKSTGMFVSRGSA